MNFYWKTGSEVVEIELDNVEFLEQFPRGAYTTMKSYQSGCVYELTKHIERVQYTFNTMYGQNIEFEAVKKEMIFGLKKLEDVCLMKYKGSSKTTILLGYDDKTKKKTMYIHVVDVPEVFCRDTITVDFVLANRIKYGLAKDSQWVLDRASVLKKRHKGSEEALLLEKDGKIREGCSSNFYVLKENGTVLETCNESIVMGTVRNAVLKGAAKKCKVVYKTPNMNEMDTWEGCFLSSTCRGPRIIREIQYEGKVIKEFDSFKALENVIELGFGEYKNMCEKVWESDKPFKM